MDSGHPLEAALNYVVAALQLHDSRRGARLADGIGIERLVSAVELLSSRDTIEIAPFIHEWDASVSALESTRAYVDARLVRKLHQAVQEPPHDGESLFVPAEQTIELVFPLDTHLETSQLLQAAGAPAACNSSFD